MFGEWANQPVYIMYDSFLNELLSPGKLADAKTVLQEAIAQLEASATAGNDYCKVHTSWAYVEYSLFLCLFSEVEWAQFSPYVAFEDL